MENFSWNFCEKFSKFAHYLFIIEYLLILLSINYRRGILQRLLANFLELLFIIWNRKRHKWTARMLSNSLLSMKIISGKKNCCIHKCSIFQGEMQSIASMKCCIKDGNFWPIMRLFLKHKYSLNKQIRHLGTLLLFN